MTDFIPREAVCLTDFEIAMCNGDYKELCKMILDKVANAPAADVRPVVLCGECDMYECHEYDGGLKYVCRLFKRQMQETDFCSYGEKREES